ncbi:Cation channel sperm-associated protein 2 [Sorochytrium milnesiophthora]
MALAVDSEDDNLSALVRQQERADRNAQQDEEDQARRVQEEDLIPDVFHDLNPRSKLFRNRLIEEFRLLDGARADYSSRDVKDPAAFAVLLESRGPSQLVDFFVYRHGGNHHKIDRRETRVKAKAKVTPALWAKWVLNTAIFRNTILLLVILTSITSGISSDLSYQQYNYYTMFDAINIIDTVATWVFVIEIALKVTDDFWGFWVSGWNMLDLATTVVALVPFFIDVLGLTAKANSFSAFQSLRTLRVLRTLKLILRFGNLKVIVLTVIEAFKSLALILILIGIFMYIFAILAMYLFDAYTHSTLQGLLFQDEFSTLGGTLGMLFQLMTMDSWSTVTSDLVLVVDPVITYLWAFIWLWLGGFILRSIFVGIMVSNFNKLDSIMQSKKEAAAKEKRLKKLRQRLNEELEAQNNMQQSMQNLKDVVQVVKQSAHALDEPHTPPGEPEPGAGNREDELAPVPQSTAAAGLGPDEAATLPNRVAQDPTLDEPNSELTKTGSYNEMVANLLRGLSSPNILAASGTGGGTGIKSATPVESLAQLLSQHAINAPPDYRPDYDYNAEVSPSKSARPSSAGAGAHLRPPTAGEAPPDADDNGGSVARIAQAIQHILNSTDRNWNNIVEETLYALGGQQTETLWPRDTLFRYLQLMESLQENMRELNELQVLAIAHLLQMFDD